MSVPIKRDPILENSPVGFGFRVQGLGFRVSGFELVKPRPSERLRQLPGRLLQTEAPDLDVPKATGRRHGGLGFRV